MFSGNEFRAGKPEGAAHVSGSGGLIELRLARRILLANDGIGLHEETEPSADPLGKKEGRGK